jgi:hypothetical protein
LTYSSKIFQWEEDQMVLRWLANIDSKLLNKQNETIKTTISCIRVGKWEKTFKLALPSAEENK